MDKLTSMRVFCRVVARENFSRAARDLGISAAMVTKHIAALEDQLQVRLLNRTTRKVSTTEAGARYYHICRQLLDELESAESELADVGSRPRGTLRLTAPVDFGVLSLAPAIARFMNDHPELRIDISYQDYRVDLLQEGLDMAIRIGNLSDSSLVARRIMPQRKICCASPEYLERHGEPRTPEDLRHHNCLTYSYASAGNEWVFVKEGKKLSVRVEGRMNANNGRAMVAAAAEGLGIINKPEFLVNDLLAEGRLRAILTDWENPAVNVWAVYPHREYVPAKVRLFIDFLQTYFAATSPATAAPPRQAPAPR